MLQKDLVDPIAIQHELQRVRKELRLLNTRKVRLQQILRQFEIYKKDILPPSFFEKEIWLYVLLCVDGKYYVGSSRNVDKRFIRHQKGKGAQWTKKYKPITVIARSNTGLTEEGEAAKLEDELTFEYVLQYGMDNVRGGGYCQTKPRWPKHLYEQVANKGL